MKRTAYAIGLLLLLQGCAVLSSPMFWLYAAGAGSGVTATAFYTSLSDEARARK